MLIGLLQTNHSPALSAAHVQGSLSQSAVSNPKTVSVCVLVFLGSLIRELPFIQLSSSFGSCVLRLSIVESLSVAFGDTIIECSSFLADL